MESQLPPEVEVDEERGGLVPTSSVSQTHEGMALKALESAGYPISCDEIERRLPILWRKASGVSGDEMMDFWKSMDARMAKFDRNPLAATLALGAASPMPRTLGNVPQLFFLQNSTSIIVAIEATTQKRRWMKSSTTMRLVPIPREEVSEVGQSGGTEVALRPLDTFHGQK